MRKRRKFSREFKIEAVRMMEESGKPAAQVARELGIGAELLYMWKRRLASAPLKEVFPGNGHLSPAEEENRRGSIKEIC